MFCPNCGKEILENIRFCNYCGAEQSVIPSSAFFQEESQQQQTVTHVENRNALRLGGFCLVALSILSVLLCLAWHQYEHFIYYINIMDIALLLVQSCMAVGGILMICRLDPRAVLQIGGIALIVLSALSIFVCFYYRQHEFLIATSSLITTGETVVTGWFELILIQSCMVVVGIIMIFISKGKER